MAAPSADGAQMPTAALQQDVDRPSQCDSSCLSSAPRSPSLPSSPLSMFSRSPSPPVERRTDLNYPSPPSTQDSSEVGSPDPQIMQNKDDEPPTKRRRLSKDRTTTYVDLSQDDDEESRTQIERVMRVLHKRKKIVVVAGAGISVTAGIPDFRSENGLFATLKSEFKLKGSGKDLFDASVYRDTGSAAMFHKMVSSMSETIETAEPTPFHHMLATLAHEGRLLRLYSQNVDELETSLEPLRTTIPLRKLETGQWPKTIQLHGGLAKMECTKCHHLSDFDRALFEGPIPPACTSCLEINNIRTEVEGKRSHGVGYLKPRMVLYGEPSPDGLAIGSAAAQDLKRRPDAIIVVGTSLKVPGIRRIVREMCAAVRDHRDGVAIWLNKDPPPSGAQFEDKWDIVVTGEADDIARRAAFPRWDDSSTASDSDDSSASNIQVAIDRKRIPSTLNFEAPPSDSHINNSFRPPTSSDSPASAYLDIAPVASPLTVRKASRTVKDIAIEDSIKIEHGLMTPTKQQPKPSIAFSGPPNLSKASGDTQQTVTAKLKAAASSTKAKTGSTKVPKTTQPKKPRAKPAKKVLQPQPLNTLPGTYNVSKAAISNLINKENEDSVCSTPGKKKAEMPKKLNTPSKPKPCFPNLSPAKRPFYNVDAV